MTLAIQASRTLTKEQLCLLEPVPEPCAIVIFGASGDLTERKLMPSLFYLAEQNIMPKNYYVLGVARTPLTETAFQEKLRSALPKGAPTEKMKAFLSRLHYLSGDYADVTLYQQLTQVLRDLDKKYGVDNKRLFYLSTPPSLYADIIDRLGESGLSRADRAPQCWTRVVIEKPFGHSLASAQELNKNIRFILEEKQIYRIDHYLAKETVQNILMFRFANIMFDPIWNRNYIDHVQITAAEELGVEHRAGYYEQAGVLRDMFQNHLLQVLSLIAMEPPANMEADAMRNRRLDVLKSIRSMSPLDVEKNTVCAQYGPGEINGQKAAGYLEEKGVNPHSRIATYAAIRFDLDNWRWQGVPFYIRSGKRLADRTVDISIHFKFVPASIFKPLLADQLSPNVLRFRIQPDEGISMSFEAKHPGPKLCMSTVTMNFGYQDTFKTPPPESYARLFQDAMIGDQTLFARSDQVEESWKIIDPIINHWESAGGPPLPVYPAGSWGPSEADSLLAQTGRVWDV